MFKNKEKDFKSFKNNGKDQKVTSPIIEQLRSNPAFLLQRKYWTSDHEEKASLLSKYPVGLTEKELLRLVHLICIEYLESEKGGKHLNEDDFDQTPEWGANNQNICTEIVSQLLDKKSAFCSKKCFIWQGEVGESQNREPDHQGDFLNASLSHLGCLEVIKVDEKQSPLAVDFIPFDAIRGVVFAQPSLFRAAKIFYDSEKEDEIVLIPMNYGLSWMSFNEFDHDGSMTRFCCHIETKNGTSMGLGLGQQDFTVIDSNGNQQMFGINSIGEIMVGLEITDPKFEIKCKARGLDPAEVMKQIKV